jgi:hypothetical protein
VGDRGSSRLDLVCFILSRQDKVNEGSGKSERGQSVYDKVAAGNEGDGTKYGLEKHTRGTNTWVQHGTPHRHSDLVGSERR